MENAEGLKRKIRERVRDLLLEPPFLGSQKIDHTDIAEALIHCAYAECDFKGGIDDTCHAAKKLHKLVDDVGKLRNKDYSPTKLQSYLKKATQA